MRLFIETTKLAGIGAAVLLLSACQTTDKTHANGATAYSSAPSSVRAAPTRSGASSTGFDLSGASGGSEFTIAVSDDDSYTDAAAQALDRCSQQGKKPTAPMQRIVGGSTVLAYSCR